MTGSGTQADPFIVDNWADYCSAVNRNPSAYIEFDNNYVNKIIDFNDIKPDGYSYTVNFSRYTKFNGWTLRNFYSTASVAMSFGDAGTTISGLILENFYWQTSNASYFLNCNPNYDYTSVFYNCIFSGRIAVSGSNISFCNGRLSRCALNLSVSFTAGEFKIARNNIENSDIVLDVKSDNALYLSGSSAINSRFSGKISASSVHLDNSSLSSCNVYNLESGQPLIYGSNGISLFNSDLATVSESSTDALKACTTEQLRNAEYLYNLGFPIGVD